MIVFPTCFSHKQRRPIPRVFMMRAIPRPFEQGPKTLNGINMESFVIGIDVALAVIDNTMGHELISIDIGFVFVLEFNS